MQCDLLAQRSSFHSAASQKLRSLIDQYARGYGTTPSGKDWCIKALHPSDPITEVRGIPDESAAPSAFLNYQSTFTLGATAGATGTWQFDASVLPHPVNFMYLEKTDSTGTNSSNFMNTQLTGATHYGKTLSLLAAVRRWRLAYMSVTVYQDGADLTNQGTLVCAQVPVKPLRYAISSHAMHDSSSYADYAGATVEVYEAADNPNFEVLQAMPNAYFGRSKDGAYIPLKLTKTCQSWHSASDLVFASDTNLVHLSESTGWYPVTYYTGTPGGKSAAFPHTNLQAVYSSTDPVLGPPLFFGEATSPMCNDTWAQFSARNLSVNTSYSFFVRAGYEIQVQPSSIYSTHLKLSPPHDELALNTYFAISRELKDAYPADHNDLGKIWEVISSIAKTVAPALAAIPGFGMPLSMAVSGVATAGDAIRSALTRGSSAMEPRSSKRGAPSMADATIARNIVSVAREAPQRQRRRARKPRKQKKPQGAPKITILRGSRAGRSILGSL